MAGKEIAVKKYVVRLDAEERDRLIPLGQMRRYLDRALGLAVPKDVNLIGRGKYIHLRKFLTENGIQER